MVMDAGEEGGGAYEPSVQMKTCEKPQERTRASDSLRDGGGLDAMVERVVDRASTASHLWLCAEGDGFNRHMS